MEKRRRTYPRKEYLQKREALFSLVKKAKRVELDPNEHSVTGICTAPVIYLDSSSGPLFDELNREHFDCRELKIINPKQPAISLHYTVRHKYKIERKPTQERILGYLESRLEELNALLESNPDLEGPKKQLAFIRTVYSNPGRYTFAISNYFRYYRYPYVTYRYVDGKGFSTTNTHLIASYLMEEDEDQEQFDAFPRYNIIFVDMEAICHSRPANDHAQAATYLNTFDYRLDFGKRDLFIKKNRGRK